LIVLIRCETMKKSKFNIKFSLIIFLVASHYLFCKSSSELIPIQGENLERLDFIICYYCHVSQ
jgi:hypothetical protein